MSTADSISFEGFTIDHDPDENRYFALSPAPARELLLGPFATLAEAKDAVAAVVDERAERARKPRRPTRTERLQAAADAGYDTWADYNGDK